MANLFEAKKKKDEMGSMLERAELLGAEEPALALLREEYDARVGALRQDWSDSWDHPVAPVDNRWAHARRCACGTEEPSSGAHSRTAEAPGTCAQCGLRACPTCHPATADGRCGRC